ncbi:chitobiase/beta-hexosaminidase C-terminal domain-containing protein [Paenibacillus sp. S150]|uniref:chitobiase/beta-hexosaminidase C-terminal domain-containing protein n=1 Tax=Paenibacillus sp. S150 TaxID=2749826 RepID=UPI001C56F564|nr:chitobiase/beta-hexosaminidase C-terminal domain-containing protein [Paenibacillus sp. S150]
MATKHKSLIGLAVALIVLAVAAVAGGLMAKADGQTWTSSADTSWYNPVYTTFKIDTAEKLAGVAKLVNEDGDGTVNGLNGKILEIDKDLDLSAHLWVPIGNGEHPFRGTLISKDGAILRLSGMNVQPSLSYQGLVGNMDGATVGGFEFTSSGSISVTSVTYDVYAGAAVGKMTGNSTVYDIINKIKIETISLPFHAYAGGIVGMGTGSIANSVNEAAITANGASTVGGIVGYGGPGSLKIKKASNSGALLVNGLEGTSYAGGIAGHTSGSLIMNDEDTAISNTASVTATGGEIVYAGGIIGRTDGTIVFSSATASGGAVSVNAPGATGAYAGGLIGAVGAVQNPDISIAFAHTAPVTNNGGMNVYTGAIAGYADSALSWSAAYNNANPVTATGSQNIYTGGFIGYAAKGIMLNNPAAGAYQNTAAINVSGGTAIYTGGIAGYDAGGSIMNASFTGSLNVAGADGVYTGGIAGYEIGGVITASQAGAAASPFNTIISDGTVGGIAGYLEGTISNSAVKHITLKTTSEGGVVGGIAGSAQGTITGVLAGDAAGADYNSLRIEAEASVPAADGRDNVTAGGLVGSNDKALALTDSLAAKIGFINVNGRSGYTFGGVAGRLNNEASIGTAAQAVAASDIIVELKAEQVSFGGAVGDNRASALHLHTNRIEIRALAANGYAGGMFGENHGASPYVLAENITIGSPGPDNAVGGIAGFNTGTLTDVTARSVVIEASGPRTEAGGIAGRSEGLEGSRAGIITPVMLAGENAVITVTGTEVKAGGIAGFAKATDIVKPAATAVAPDYVIFSISGIDAKAGGLAGALENSTISGDTAALNAENLLINTTKDAANAYIGGFVGYNDQSRLERLVGRALNLTLNGPNVQAGGMSGYNLGSNTAVITNNYITAFSLKTNATAAGAIIGGIVGLNDARAGDPVQNPGTAVSTLQNSRTLGSINAASPASVVGGMVGENRSLIANNSITDKLPVSSKGANVIFGGLAGRNTAAGTLYYTYSNANLTIEGEGTLAGGLAGENAGQVKGSYVDIDITGKAAGTAGQPVFLGGLIGRNSAGAVEQSYTSSKITASGSYTVVGGLVGEHTGGTIKNSYVAKSVTADSDHSYAGGFIGRITNGKVSNAYSAAEVNASSGAYAGGFAGRYDNASKELLYKSYYIKDEDKNINKDLPDFAEGNHRWLDVHVRLTTILSETLRDREVFPGLSGWDFTGAWKYGSLNAEYKYPEVNREANTGGDTGGDVNSNINWYMKDKDAILFQITSEAELAGLAAIVNGTIAGVDSFDFAGRTITVAGPIHIQSKQWTPIGDTEENAFQGTFEGGSHLIDGLTLQSAVFSNSGLFGVIGDEGTVKNINLEPLSIAGSQYTGALAGQNKGTVSNIDLKLLNGVKISGGTVGGILGKNTGALASLHLTLDGGSRIETVYTGGIAGGIAGDNASDITYVHDADRSKTLAASTYLLTAVDGSIGSSADQAVIGGLIGRQAGNVTGMKEEASPKYRIASTGMNTVTGGLIGRYVTGTADQLTLEFKDGQLEALGLDSVLGGLIGHLDTGAKITGGTVTGPGTGVQLKGNGTIGGIAGTVDGAAGGMKLSAASSGNVYDIDHSSVSGVAISAVDGSLEAVIGGIAGEASDAAVNDVQFRGSLQSAGEANMAGGILGQGVNTLLYNVNAAPQLAVTAKNGATAVGGIAGSMSATDLNEGFEFGKAYPLYRGIYLAKAHTGSIEVTGAGNAAELNAGGIAGRNENASIYRSEAAIDLNVTGGNTASVGGIAGYSSGIIVDAAAQGSLNAGNSRVYNAGGIVGWGEGGEIHYSSISGADGQAITLGTAVTMGEAVPSTRAGGLVGLGDDMKITYSHADIPLRITDTNQDNTIYAGGFAGLLGDTDIREGSIERSYATGAVTVSGRLGAYAGGFAGSVDHFSIRNAYASGNIDNTGFDTRSGGFAGTVERSAVISDSYALQAKVSTVGVKSSPRSYTGGFAGYNDGTLSGVYAGVPDISVNVTGSTVYAGRLAGYNFRDGQIIGSTFSPAATAQLPAVGRNAGAEPGAVSVDAFDPLASGKWNIDFDTSFMDHAADGVATLVTPQQLKGAVLLYNETGIEYYRLYNRTATGGLALNKLLLGADIDLGGSPWTAIDSFTAEFDGQGHTISGLRLGKEDSKYAGFVSENSGKIINVGFAGARIEAGKDAGIVAGINHAGAEISGVTISGSVAASETAGGAAGINLGTLTALRTDNLTVQGAGYAGGIAGINSGTIAESASAGSIGTGGPAAGGITAQNTAQGIIKDSMSYADVQAAATEAAAGGIAGLNAGEINNTYASGRIKAFGTNKAWAGGIAGHATAGSILSSLNTGEASAAVNGKLLPQQAFFGGIAGQKDNGAIISRSAFNRQMLKRNIAYYDGAGKSKAGEAGEGLPAAQLVAAALPAGLDANQWTAHEGFYPVLNVFSGTAEGLLGSAAVILNPQDLINRVDGSFSLSSGIAWSADPSKAALSGTTGKLQTSGSAVLTAAAQGKSRSIAINEAAVKFPEQAVPPAVVSGDKVFNVQVNVVLATAEPGGSIYYTLDGSRPTENSQLYKEPIVLRSAAKIRAVTILEGKEYSEELAGEWSPPSYYGGPITIVAPPVKEPAISAVAGTTTTSGGSEAPVKVAKNSRLKLTAPEGQTIYYTTDGSTPTVNSTKYTGELLITGNMTIKMITDQDDTVITIEYVVENAKYSLKSNAGEVKYMIAPASGLFQPNAAITRYETIAALAPLLDMEEVNVGNLFNDVNAENQALTAFFASAGIVEGYPDGGFGGGKGLTRAEFSKIMTTVLKLDVTENGVTKQPDLKGHWSEQYVNALSKAGYVQGFPDGTFKPGDPITRAQAVVLINRIAGTQKLNVTAVRFKDLPATHWAYKDIMSVIQ